MALIDLLRLLRHYLALVIILPLVFALVMGAFMLARGQASSYTASAYVVVGTSAQLSTLSGTASAAARDYASSNSGSSASTKVDATSLTVTVTAAGSDAAGAIAAANEIADSAVESARGLLGRDGVSANVQKATQGSLRPGNSLIAHIFVSVLVGLFAAVCIVVAIDTVRRPVKGSADLEAASGLPVLGELPGSTGERLLANARFASGKKGARTVLVVPARSTEPATAVGMLLDRAAKAESPEESKRRGGAVRVGTCAPLLQRAAAAYQAHAADVVLVAAAQWADSRKDVELTISELKLAGANVAGCVLVKSGRAVRRQKRRVQ